jgi:hypothetical protein
MSKNTGKPYEKLTKRIFEAILARQDVKHLRVEHDVPLPGITTEHQVDVYWEFEVGGITYRTVVECKDCKKPVGQGVLLSLFGKLQDLPGQPRGVVVTRSGFQKGAKQYAKAQGIGLYELRAPLDKDWKGFITSVEIKGELLAPKVHDVQFKADKQWLLQEMSRIGISMADLPRITGMAGALRIEREDGSVLATLGDIIERHLLPDGVGPPEWREHVFAENAYIATGFPALPRVRLCGVRVLIELVVAFTQNIEVKLEQLVGLILKDVTTGTFRVFDAQGIPLQAGQPRPARIAAIHEDSRDP